MKLRNLAPVVLLAACSSGNARQDAAAANAAPAGPLPRPVAAPAIFGLFGERQALGLTSDQVNRLEAIALELRQRNDSLETAIRDEQERRGRIRSVGDRQRAIRDALPTLGQIWSNNRRASDQVREVLTPEQRERVCALERERMPERELEERQRAEAAARNRNRPFPRMRGPRPLRPDSTLVAVRGWAWCAASGATSIPVPAAAPAPTPGHR